MRWQRVAQNRVQPDQGSYQDWKKEIADDCSQQCVYCAIHESRYGGLDNFHVEHLRPKSLFEALKLIITNLFLACAICNRFKSNDWPGETKDDHSVPGYPDPCQFDYNELFDIDNHSFTVEGRFVVSRYLTERLYLNRPQLILERRNHSIQERIDELQTFALASRDLANTEDQHHLKLYLQLLTGVVELSQKFTQAQSLRPYELEDIRRRQ